MKKTPPPNMTSAFRFCLRDHMWQPKGKLAPAWEIVEDFGDSAIYRRPEIRFDLNPATPPTDEEQARFMMARMKQADSDDILTLCAQIDNGLSTLAMKARNGDSKALFWFIHFATEAAGGLREMTASNPDAMRPFAKADIRWPLMRSTAPHLSEPDETLKKIGLGEDLNLQMDRFSKWKADRAAALAVALIQHVESVRKKNPRISFEDANERDFADWLPPFEKATAEKWWDVACKFMLASYPKPERVPEFSKVVTAKSKSRSPGRVRQAILEKIEARFRALAK